MGEDDAGVDVGGLGGLIDAIDAVHVPGEVQNNAGAYGVACHGCPATPAHQRCACFPACGHRSDDILDASWEGHGKRRNSVVGRVIGIRGNTVARFFGKHARSFQPGKDRCMARGGEDILSHSVIRLQFRPGSRARTSDMQY
ncbi:hypothetical protein StoSoilB13_04000 [Arthrobacter sp. StoSoilB13]|nr:hypothetical protein StoSoilB13_04000 [Arthrobacter sp. StoSoilB13]